MPADPQIELLAAAPDASAVIIHIDSNESHTSSRVHNDTARDGDCCRIDADHHLAWAVSPTTPSLLTLSETKNDSIIAQAQLQFPGSTIIPSVAAVVHQSVHLIVLCADGQLYRITLPQRNANTPLLHALRQPTSSWLTCRALPQSTATPTTMLVAQGSIAIGTADGTLVCTPIDDFDAGDQLAVSELRDAGNTLGRLFSGNANDRHLLLFLLFFTGTTCKSYATTCARPTHENAT